MKTDISDAENAFLEGKAQWDEFLEGFLRDWYAPMAKTMIAMMLETMPAEVRAQYDPQVLKKAEEFVKS